MADYFVNQNFRLRADSKNVLTGATVYLGYFRPDGKIGRWTGSINPSNSNEILYNVTFPIAGKWLLWSYVVFADLTIGIGKVWSVKILNEGQLN